MSPLCLPPVKPDHYRPDIDGLRAIAIVSVVIFHTFPKLLPGGFVGVDIFFVISGYLISTIIFRSLEKKSFVFLDFYARRIRRIFPALSFLLVGVMLLGALLLTPEEFKNLGKQAIYGSAFGENIFLITHSGGYWDTATEMKPLMHLWTLAVEEQYYIFYPLICWLLWRLKKTILPFLCLLWLVSFGFDIYQNQSSPIVAFFSLHTRFWELSTGCILAAVSTWGGAPLKVNQSTNSKTRAKISKLLLGLWSSRRFLSSSIPFKEKRNEAGSIIGITLIVTGILFASGDDKLRPLLIFLPVLGTAIIISCKDSWLNKRVLSSPPFVFIGLISYTWYLWHWPLLSIARNVNDGELPDYWICCLLLLLGFTLSLFSYFVIETPVRRKKISKKLTISLSFCVLGCALLGLVIQSIDGFPSRLGAEAAIARSNKNTFPKKNEYAAGKYGCPENMEFCWAPENSHPSIALIGDSHAHHLAFGLKKNLNKQFLLVGHPGTPPVKGLISLSHEKNSNKPLMEKALDILNSDPTINTVILSARWHYFVNSKKGAFRLLDYKNEDRLLVLEKLLTQSIGELVRHKKKVILVLDVPHIPLNPKNCIKSRPFQENTGICTFSEDQRMTNDDKINGVIRKVAKEFPSVSVVDASKALCHQGVCSIGNGVNSIYYHDDNHLTDKGSDLVAKDILRQGEF